MLLRSSEVRLLFIDLYQNSTQHSVVAVVPPTPTTPNKPPPDDESLPRKLSRTETSALAVSLHLSHPGVQSSGASAEQWAAHDQAAPCTTRGWLNHPHTPPSFIFSTPSTHISVPLCCADRSSRSIPTHSRSSLLGCICLLCL